MSQKVGAGKTVVEDRRRSSVGMWVGSKGI